MTPDCLWTIRSLPKTFTILLEPDTSPNRLEHMPDQDMVTHLPVFDLSGCPSSPGPGGPAGKAPADQGRAREKLETVVLLY